MIVVRFKVQAKPNTTEELLAALRDVIAPSRQIEGCIEFDIARCLDDPNSFIATEVFEDRAALDRQEQQSQVGTVLSLLPEVIRRRARRDDLRRRFGRAARRLNTDERAPPGGEGWVGE
jgi:quinol monooxygenase YgiN